MAPYCKKVIFPVVVLKGCKSFIGARLHIIFRKVQLTNLACMSCPIINIVKTSLLRLIAHKSVLSNCFGLSALCWLLFPMYPTLVMHHVEPISHCPIW